ncbi:MAG: zf-HC2 domain-containing protein [Polyangia bacterium]|jgi:anti-sigma factor RsiW|nr:zf-HC2 domain-containing protein [Polyangia bacterium]
MNCQDMEKFIHVYLDREFASEDRADFERHLAECAACRRLATFEQRFKQQLRTSLGPPYLRLDEREALRLRIRSTLENAAPRPASHPAWRWAMGLVPATGAAALLVGLALLGRDQAEKEASGPARTFQVESQDPRTVRAFYRDKLGFQVDPPRFNDRRTTLMGARIGQLETREAAHLLYRHGDQPFSVLMFKPHGQAFSGKTARLVGNTKVFYGAEAGRPVATFSHRGVGYSITGDLPAHVLDGLVRDVVLPTTFPSQDLPVDAVPVGAPGGR